MTTSIAPTVPSRIINADSESCGISSAAAQGAASIAPLLKDCTRAETSPALAPKCCTMTVFERIASVSYTHLTLPTKRIV